MKICPTCGRGYSDDLSFCLEDGSRLPGSPTIGLTSAPTEDYPRVTNKNADIAETATVISRSKAISPKPKQFKMSAVDPATRMGCIVTVGQVSAVLLLVFGLGLAGILYTYRGGSYETASGGPEVYDPSINPPTTAANANTTFANVSANRISAKPAPSATGDPPKTISVGVVNSKAVTLPQPSYPPAARAVSASGSVNVQVLIDENGKVVSANAVSGHPLLRGAAVEAARSATFKPTLLSGRPVKVSGVITYNFVP